MNATEQRIANFRFFCQKVLPAVYDDSLSYYELLCKVVDYLNKCIDELNNHGDAITELQESVAKLQEDFDKFKESGFEDYYAKQLEQWIRDNAERIIKEMMLIGVTFGLTQDGYFVAYIPETWNDVVFDTGMVYGRSDYGCLCLQYSVDAEGVIDNAYSYLPPNANEVNVYTKMASDVEMLMNAMFTPLDEMILGRP